MLVSTYDRYYLYRSRIHELFDYFHYDALNIHIEEIVNEDNEYTSIYLIFDRKNSSRSNQYNRIDHKDMSTHRLYSKWYNSKCIIIMLKMKFNPSEMISK
jgi:hypothetical protein